MKVRRKGKRKLQTKVEPPMGICDRCEEHKKIHCLDWNDPCGRPVRTWCKECWWKLTLLDFRKGVKKSQKATRKREKELARIEKERRTIRIKNLKTTITVTKVVR